MSAVPSPGRAVAFTVLGMFAAGALVLVAMSSQPGTTTTSVLTDESGQPMTAPSELGVAKAIWNNNAVLVFTVTESHLAAVDAARGEGSATKSSPVPGHDDWRVFALSAKSTHLGCSVTWRTDLGASRDIADYDMDGMPDGVVIDQCHQGQWDAFHQAEPFPGTPAPTPLAALDVQVEDGLLVASTFDRPIGPAES